ncbi:MAG TPA: FAD:protein FMN transferase [Longimicrobiales bacterium]|nr:FAD:protein FMN transferase [Longimicrobiales bacterium]
MRVQWRPLALALLVACTPTPPAPTPAPAPAPAPARNAAPEPAERVWPVMGTMLRVVAWESDPDTAAAVLRAARAEVVRVDSLMSTYRDDSDLSRVNRAAGTGEWTHVSPETLEVLLASLEYARSSDGAFDPTVGPLVDVWGFYRESGAMPPAAALDSAGALVDWRRVEVRADVRLVRLPLAGMRLDFGAIAKGYAVDLALAAARRAGAGRAMIDLGGNIGVLGDAPAGESWPFGLRHPRHPESSFAVIAAESGVVATSGDYERYFVHDGVRYAHIVDPRTGWPVQGVASVSVLAPTGVASDALSTTLFVLGVERGCAVAAGLPGVAAVWVLAPDVDREEAPLRAVVGGPLADRVEVAANVELAVCAAAAR